MLCEIKRGDNGVVIHSLDLPEGALHPERAVIEDGGRRGIDFSYAQLSNKQLCAVMLESDDIVQVYLDCAFLRGADFTSASMPYISLVTADIQNAILDKANMRCADLSFANLTGSRLSGTMLEGADLSRTIGLRRKGMPAPDELRRLVAEIVRADEGQWNPALVDDVDSSAPFGVAGWTCRLGGGTYGYTMETAATILLWQDGKPMPSFHPTASNKEILKALEA